MKGDERPNLDNNTDEESKLRQEYEAFQQWWAQMKQNRNRLRKKRHGHQATEEHHSLAETILAQRKVKDDLPLGTSASHLYREEFHNRKQHSASRKNGRATRDTSDTESDSVSDTTKRTQKRRVTAHQSLEDLSETTTTTTDSLSGADNRGTYAPLVKHTKGKQNHKSERSQPHSAKQVKNSSSHHHHKNKSEEHLTSANRDIDSVHNEDPRVKTTKIERDQYHLKEGGSVKEDYHNTVVQRKNNSPSSPPRSKYNGLHINEVPANHLHQETIVATSLNTVQQKSTTNKDSRHKPIIDATTRKKSRTDAVKDVNHKRDKVGVDEKDEKSSGYNNTDAAISSGSSSASLLLLSSGSEGERLDTGYTSGNESINVTAAHTNYSDNKARDNTLSGRSSSGGGIITQQAAPPQSTRHGSMASSTDQTAVNKSKPDQSQKPSRGGGQRNSQRAVKTSGSGKQRGSMDTKPTVVTSPSNSLSMESRSQRGAAKSSRSNTRKEDKAIKDNALSPGSSGGGTSVLDKANLISWEDSNSDNESNKDNDSNNHNQHPMLPPLIQTPTKTPKSDREKKNPAPSGVKLPQIPRQDASSSFSSPTTNSPWAQQPEIPSHLKHLSNDYVPLRVSSLPENSRNNLNNEQGSRRHSGPTSRKPPNSARKAASNVDFDRMERQVDEVLGDIIEKYSNR